MLMRKQFKMKWRIAALAVFGSFCMLLSTLLIDESVNAAAALPESQYQNPIGPRIPDPFILKASDGKYYAYGTTGFQAWSSTDLVHWKSEGVVFPSSNRLWGVKDFWAPEVVEYKGRFYLYYSAERAGGGKRIGVAVSDRPTGPFVDTAGKPLFDPGYATIDAHVFIDNDGRKYLYYAQDQARFGSRYESRIYVVELGDDMISVVGEPVLCTKPDQPWEMLSGPNRLWNEGPTVIKHDSTYYLMYSANFYNSRNYAVGYATSDSPKGPFTKSELNPVVRAEGSHVSGPGHHSITRSPDGKELFIAYHSHVDAAAGQGARQMNIDRMGFRADGSIFVNGPTVTPQPTPSGNLGLYNIAPEATVTTSSEKAGYSNTALIDSEIGIYKRNEAHDWVSAGEGRGAWAQLTWAQERRVGMIFIYGSADPDRRVRTGRLLFSDGTIVEGVQFPETPGSAAIIHAPATDIKWVRFEAGELATGAGTAALSEIVALSYPPESVWLASPQDGVVARGDLPVMVAAPDVSLVDVRIELDGKVIYQGDNAPSSLMLRTAELEAGKHQVVLNTVDRSGKAQRYAADIQIEHMKLETPILSWGEILRNSVPIKITPFMPADDIKGVLVQLTPVVDNEQIINVYKGATLPVDITLDTLAIPDGAYDFKISLTTKAGIVSTLTQRIVVDNWSEVVDEIQPPLSSSWFNTERLLTVEKSAGWEYVVEDVDSFMGDGDRIRRLSNTEEYLTWQASGLVAFTFTVYARQDEVAEVVDIAVKGESELWQSVAYTTNTLGRSPAGWVKLELHGVVPHGVDAELIRFTIKPGSAADSLQLGKVFLRSSTTK